MKVDINKKPDWKKFFDKRIKASNLSGYFHRILFEFIKYYGPGENILLVSEPHRHAKILKKYFNYNRDDIDVILYKKKHGEKYEYDLNILFDLNKKYDIVFCQAVLEHVCRPSILIENLSNFTKDNKYIILMSESPKKKYHPYPVDCVRFFKDFYKEMCNYLPIKLIEYEEDDKNHHFVVYKKVVLDNDRKKS